MIIDHIHTHYEIRGKKIDPETQEVFEDKVYALTTSMSDALYIAKACNRYQLYPSSSFYVEIKNERKV